MVQDSPRYMIPDNAVWDANEVIIDMDGNISKRGGTKNVMTSASVLVGGGIAILRSRASDATLRGYVFENGSSVSVGNAGSGAVYSFVPGSGTSSFTTDGTTRFFFDLGTPAQYSNVIGIGEYADSGQFQVVSHWVAGAPPVAGVLAASATLTAGSTAATGISAPDIAKLAAGQLLCYSLAASIGVFRVVSVGATSCVVEPTPTTGGTFSFNVFSHAYMSDFNSSAPPTSNLTGGQSIEAHQSRVVLGCIGIKETGVSNTTRYDSRVMWSILPTETSSLSAASQGLLQLSSFGFETLNYVDIPRLQRIVGLMSVSDNRLLVLGSQGVATIDGALPTNTAANSILTGYQVNTVSTSVGCLSQRSIQRTPRGVVFASRDGIYLYDGAALHNITLERIQQYWATLVGGGSFVIYGSAVINPTTYLISGSSGGTAFTLICNLTGYRWSRSSSLSIIASAQDPSDPTRVYVCDAGSTTSSTTNKVYRLDPILFPTSANTTDHTGTAPSWSIKTKADTGVAFSGRGRRLRVLEDPSILKKYKHATVVMNVVGSGSAVVTATPGLQAEEASQTVETFTANANPQTQRVMLTTQVISKAMGFTIAGSTAASSVDLISIQTDPNALSMKRVT